MSSRKSRSRSLMVRSGVVSAAMKVNELSEQYEELQELERKAVAAGATFEEARKALVETGAKRDEASATLTKLSVACRAFCDASGVAVDVFEALDKDDVTGLAKHLEPHVSRIDGLGPGMVEKLRHQRKLVEKLDETLAGDAARLRKLEQQAVAALFALEGGISVGRAFLQSKGLQVRFPRKAPKPKKKAHQPESANNGHDTDALTRASARQSDSGTPHSSTNGAPMNGSAGVGQPPSSMLTGGTPPPN